MIKKEKDGYIEKYAAVALNINSKYKSLNLQIHFSKEKHLIRKCSSSWLEMKYALCLASLNFMFYKGYHFINSGKYFPKKISYS